MWWADIIMCLIILDSWVVAGLETLDNIMINILDIVLSGYSE